MSSPSTTTEESKATAASDAKDEEKASASDASDVSKPSVSDGDADGAVAKAVPLPISSNPIVITRESFAPPSGENAPPSAIIENAMTRNRTPMPLSKLIGIGCAVFVVLVGLTLLLFR